jgi:hypothetical protein
MINCYPLPSGGFFFTPMDTIQIPSNPTVVDSIIIALREDSCVVVLGGVVWGKCGYVMGFIPKSLGQFFNCLITLSQICIQNYLIGFFFTPKTLT